MDQIALSYSHQQGMIVHVIPAVFRTLAAALLQPQYVLANVKNILGWQERVKHVAQAGQFSVVIRHFNLNDTDSAPDT